MIDAAKKAGASAVKIQTYEADSMTIKSNAKDFKINHGIWKGRYLYDLTTQQKLHLHGIKVYLNMLKKKNFNFSTPFDYKGVDLLDSLNVPFFKIALKLPIHH